MDSTERFLAEYLEDGELPILRDINPDRVQAMNDHLNMVEQEERQAIDNLSHIRFV